jgi:DNA-binding transcriptional ArsR family regulator
LHDVSTYLFEVGGARSRYLSGTSLHFYKNRYNDHMDTLSIVKTLSNETRLNILEWLKEPELHFGLQSNLLQGSNFEGAVCVGTIADKANLAQSVISGYLAKMHKVGLLESKRVGQWTYYRRDEHNIQRFKENLMREL